MTAVLSGMAASFALGVTVTRTDIPDLCARLAELVKGHDLVVCDVAGVARPDVVTVAALARLRLTAGRYGCGLVLAGAGPDLLALIRLVGLADVLAQPGWEPEEREQPLGVEEVVDGRDPLA